MAKRDIMVILSLAPTCRTRYGNDAYLYHKASEKHKMMAQNDSEHRQIFACDGGGGGCFFMVFTHVCIVTSHF